MNRPYGMPISISIAIAIAIVRAIHESPLRVPNQ